MPRAPLMVSLTLPSQSTMASSVSLAHSSAGSVADLSVDQLVALVGRIINEQ